MKIETFVIIILIDQEGKIKNHLLLYFFLILSTYCFIEIFKPLKTNINIMFVKHCNRCGQNKGINYFYRKDGKGTHRLCKDCRNYLFKNKSPYTK